LLAAVEQGESGLLQLLDLRGRLLDEMALPEPALALSVTESMLLVVMSRSVLLCDLRQDTASQLEKPGLDRLGRCQELAVRPCGFARFIGQALFAGRPNSASDTERNILIPYETQDGQFGVLQFNSANPDRLQERICGEHFCFLTRYGDHHVVIGDGGGRVRRLRAHDLEGDETAQCLGRPLLRGLVTNGAVVGRTLFTLTAEGEMTEWNFTSPPKPSGGLRLDSPSSFGVSEQTVFLANQRGEFYAGPREDFDLVVDRFEARQPGLSSVSLPPILFADGSMTCLSKRGDWMLFEVNRRKASHKLQFPVPPDSELRAWLLLEDTFAAVVSDGTLVFANLTGADKS
jgi:hypothetical protein